jgi:hypothetical protein
MICPECGAVNSDDARSCAKCGKDMSPRSLEASSKVRSASNSEYNIKRERRMCSLGKWVLVLGFVVYAIGFVMWAYSNHKLLYWDLGDNLKTVHDMNEWGQYLEGAGVALVIAGLVFLASTLEKMWRRLFDRKP